MLIDKEINNTEYCCIYALGKDLYEYINYIRAYTLFYT